MSAVLCSMAGVVSSILVNVGDNVADGDELIMLDSMKMEVPVVAESAGVITAVHVEKGSSVDNGSLLFSLE